MTRILIIEDDKDINKIMSGLLTKNGYEVECAFNGKEALPRIKTIPDLILMDLMLPDTTGEELLKSVPSGTPVIAVSARSTVDDKVDLLLRRRRLRRSSDEAGGCRQGKPQGVSPFHGFPP